MILVVATTPATSEQATEALGRVAVRVASASDPGAGRRLLFAEVDDVEGERVVGRLRDEGLSVVLRPAAGPQLENWMRHTRPIPVGDSLTLALVWSEHDRPQRRGLVEIDPGFGFGAGSHPATRQLLDELAERVAGGERVLDVGCGSGVLALSALRLGARRAVGVDVDGRALVATRRNAEINGLGDEVDVAFPPLDGLAGTFDIVVANIGRESLVELAPGLVAHLATGGWLGVSGFAAAHVGVIAAALRPLRVLARRDAGEWAALVLGV